MDMPRHFDATSFLMFARREGKSANLVSDLFMLFVYALSLAYIICDLHM